MQRISDPTQYTHIHTQRHTDMPRANGRDDPKGSSSATCAADEQILMRSEIYFKVR